MKLNSYFIGLSFLSIFSIIFEIKEINSIKTNFIIKNKLLYKNESIQENVQIKNIIKNSSSFNGKKLNNSLISENLDNQLFKQEIENSKIIEKYLGGAPINSKINNRNIYHGKINLCYVFFIDFLLDKELNEKPIQLDLYVKIYLITGKT